jgi:hypothetical protein
MIQKIKVSEQLIASVKSYLENHNLGRRGVENGNAQMQETGLIGEVIVYNYLFEQYPNLTGKEDGFDGGIDFHYKNKKIDVKTMGRNSYVKPHYVNNFYTMQENYESDTIVFCSYHKTDKIIEICGWLPKNELKSRGIFYKAGTVRNQDDGKSFPFRQDNYEVENRQLDDIDTLKNMP